MPEHAFPLSRLPVGRPRAGVGYTVRSRNETEAYGSGRPWTRWWRRCKKLVRRSDRLSRPGRRHRPARRGCGRRLSAARCVDLEGIGCALRLRTPRRAGGRAGRQPQRGQKYRFQRPYGPEAAHRQLAGQDRRTCRGTLRASGQIVPSGRSRYPVHTRCWPTRRKRRSPGTSSAWRRRCGDSGLRRDLPRKKPQPRAADAGDDRRVVVCKPDGRGQKKKKIAIRPSRCCPSTSGAPRWAAARAAAKAYTR